MRTRRGPINKGAETATAALSPSSDASYVDGTKTFGVNRRGNRLKTKDGATSPMLQKQPRKTPMSSNRNKLNSPISSPNSPVIGRRRLPPVGSRLLVSSVGFHQLKTQGKENQNVNKYKEKRQSLFRSPLGERKNDANVSRNTSAKIGSMNNAMQKTPQCKPKRQSLLQFPLGEREKDVSVSENNGKKASLVSNVAQKQLQCKLEQQSLIQSPLGKRKNDANVSKNNGRNTSSSANNRKKALRKKPNRQSQLQSPLGKRKTVANVSKVNDKITSSLNNVEQKALQCKAKRQSVGKSSLGEKENDAKATKIGRRKNSLTNSITQKPLQCSKPNQPSLLQSPLGKRKDDADTSKVNERMDSSANDVTQKVLPRKPPIWSQSSTKSDLTNKRKSLRSVSNVYEFSFNSVEEAGIKKRRVNKSRKKVKPHIAKKRSKPTTLLTTDPNWQTPLVCSAAVELSKRKNKELQDSRLYGNDGVVLVGGESVRTVAESEYDFENVDVFCGNDDDENMEGFGFETASSFMPSGSEASQVTVPMISASLQATPAVSKHLLKRIGNASTPRDGTGIPEDDSHCDIHVSESQPPKTVKEDINVCFGFDDDVSEEDDLSLSPVACSRGSRLELTFISDIVEAGPSQTSQNTNSFSQPSRFSWGSLRPGYRSYASGNQSESVVVHGRSVFTNSALSSMSSNITERKKKPVMKKSDKSLGDGVQRTDTFNHQGKRNRREVEKENLIAVNSEGIQKANNVSVLFDEETDEQEHKDEEVVLQNRQRHGAGSMQNFLHKDTNQASPNKSFNQPPRRSYDKEALEKSRQKFITEYCGGNASQSETEDGPVSQQNRKRKKKTNESKKKAEKAQKTSKRKQPQTYKSSKKQKTSKKQEPQTSNDVNLSDTLNCKSSKSKRTKIKDDTLEKSIHEWASGLNSHFGEIEDFDLVVT